MLSPHLAGEEGFRVRFEAEIESLKKLRHPNIVRLYGYGEQDEYLFYAMELVEGTSLEEELRTGRRFHWREVTQLSIKICKALKHAHDHGIIHRDIKPANLLLSTGGEIRLSDFGIARLFGNTRMTFDGGVLGTAEYMAPEQADGRTVTDRCDQYSLGGVMYALLAGRPPFRAASLVEMLQLQRFAEPLPVRRSAPETPTELDRIIRQLLEKEPQKRFVNALILARALEAMDHGLSLNSQRLDFALPHEEGSPEHQPPIDALGPTLVPGDVPPLPRPGESTAPGREHLTSPAATDRTEGAAVPMAAAPAASHFIKVEDPSTDRSTWREDLYTALASWQTFAALVGLLAIGLLAWHALQGPSADQLFSRIESAAEKPDVAAAHEMRTLMNDFLARFPEDERRDQVEQWAEQARVRTTIAAAATRSPANSRARGPIRRRLGPTATPWPCATRTPNWPFANSRRSSICTAIRMGTRTNSLPRRETNWPDSKNKPPATSRPIVRPSRANWPKPTGWPATIRPRHRMRQAVVTLYADKPWAAVLVAAARTAIQGQSVAQDIPDTSPPSAPADPQP